MVCKPPEGLCPGHLCISRPGTDLAKACGSQCMSSCCKADSYAGAGGTSVLSLDSSSLSGPLSSHREGATRKDGARVWEDQARCGQLCQLNPPRGPVLTCASPPGPPKIWCLRARPTPPTLQGLWALFPPCCTSSCPGEKSGSGKLATVSQSFLILIYRLMRYCQPQARQVSLGIWQDLNVKEEVIL